MSWLLRQRRAQQADKNKSFKRPPPIVQTSYTSLPVSIPANFLAPLPDPSQIKVSKIDFEKSSLHEYRESLAIVLDDVFSQEECDELIHMAEMSAGAHRGREEPEPENEGWKPAMVNAGRNQGVLILDYRNSDRIIWDEREVARRLWERILQGEGMKDYLGALEGDKSYPVVGWRGLKRGEGWVATKQGLNERLRFLKYGPGQFFKEHCDGTYQTEDGSQTSFFTIHIYLNDSAQALESLENGDQKTEGSSTAENSPLLRGGATVFHSRDLQTELPVDPKAGRVLVFQHKGLLHSGAEVTSGVKYTMRSDLMYEFEAGRDGADDDYDDEYPVVFSN